MTGDPAPEHARTGRSAIRLFVLDYYRSQISAEPAAAPKERREHHSRGRIS